MGLNHLQSLICTYSADDLRPLMTTCDLVANINLTLESLVLLLPSKSSKSKIHWNERIYGNMCSTGYWTKYTKSNNQWPGFSNNLFDGNMAARK